MRTSYAELVRAASAENAIRFLGHEPHRHEWPHLIVMVAGSGRLSLDGTVVPLAQGHSAWLPAHMRHGLVLDPGGMVIGPMLNHDAAPPGGRARFFGPLPTLSELVMILLCAAPESDADRELFRRAFAELLRATSREHFPLVVPKNAVAQAIAIEAVSAEKTLAALAAAHFTSVRHVQRLFLQETGLSFAQWRTRARLNRAIVSLRAGEKLGAAMDASGFSTRLGLLRALSRECGIALDALRTDPGAAIAALPVPEQAAERAAEPLLVRS